MQYFLKTSLVVLLCLSYENSSANVVGSDVQNFNPTTSGLDFVTVQSSETLKPGVFNIGSFLNYAVNTLPYYDNAPQGRTQYNDSVLGADLNLGVGILNNWDAGISFPFILSQEVKNTSGYRGDFSKTGNTEVRLNTKYRVWGEDSYGVALVGSANFNRVEDNPYAGSGAGPTYNLEVAGDTTVNKTAYGINLGYRWRSPGSRTTNSFVEPFKNQIIASAAASYLFDDWDTKIISEIFTSFPAEKTNSDQERSLTSAELLVGLKHDLTTQLAVHVGGATELTNAVSSPDWRVYAGLNYSFGTISKEENTPALEEAPAPAPQAEKFVTRKIYFDTGSDKMTGDYAKILKELADHLAKSEFKELVIEGHTDSVGASDYNQRLSSSRALAIRAYLLKTFKIPDGKISAIGLGESIPIADNGNFQGRQENRRVEFKIYR